MAIYSGMFNSVNGDRKYNAWWFALFFSRFIGDGVFPNPSTGLQVFENENMTTVVKLGDGWIKGHFIHSDSDYVLQHDLADGVLKRIDRIVMRLNYTTRQIEIDIKRGKFASNPIAPTLQRDSDAHELALADVLINNGTTQIIQGNITDLRLNKELCGIVHNAIDQIDTTTLFNQYQSFFNDWSNDRRAEFDEWFLTIQDALDENAAGNLYNLVSKNTQDITNSITQRRNVTLSASHWVFDNTIEHYKYQIDDTEITGDSIVDVNVHLASLYDAKDFSSATSSFDGHVMIYANNAVNYDVVVDYRITKDVNA